MNRIAELELLLGPYQMYGDGPFGASSEHRRSLQVELARLRAKQGIPQKTNWLVSAALSVHGIYVDIIRR
jgi:hypothetical protein